jgi:hypothetical protein
MTAKKARRNSRRQFLKAGLVMAGLGISARALNAQRVDKSSADLKPGEFTWRPELSPDGPVAIVVSIPDQRVHVYRNGVRIAISTCSTGRAGHRTPTGVFTVLQKDRHHRSSTYNNAPMPNMNRLTWSGIALHAGNLPGYPASHGCIRLPLEFSRLLFEITHIGTAVILADDHSDPVAIAHPGAMLAPEAAAKMNAAVAALKIKARPSHDHAANPTPPLSVVISSHDRRIIVMHNGHIIGDGQVSIADPGRPLGTHVFVLSRANDGQLHWHGIGYGVDSRSVASALVTLQRISTDERMRDIISAHLHEGTVLKTTDLALHTESRSGRDFVLMTDETG